VIDVAAGLNADCRSAALDLAALNETLRREGPEIFQAVGARPHLFSGAAFFVSAAQLAQMREVIAAVENVVNLPAWQGKESGDEGVLGVFFGYDFHLNAEGAHLIEINTNAGGAFLNALLLQSQEGGRMPGEAVAQEDLEQVFIAMFREEWRRARGDAPLQTLVIVDERPPEQYLYPEFLLAQAMLRRAGLDAYIVDPAELETRGDGLYCAGRRVDLIYNRLTDFSLEHHPALRAAWEKGRVVLTPHPPAYARYADKRNLARLSDAEGLRRMGAAEKDIAVLKQGLPLTRIVRAEDREHWWAERKQWFFKPAAGYGGKAAYRGASVTRRVFEEIMQHDYVAQILAAPGERMVCPEGAEPAPLKSDVRCYVYNGEIQLAAARLYQGQTTNFRTPGGGFAPVRLV
jgi:hypothetical protein